MINLLNLLVSTNLRTLDGLMASDEEGASVLLAEETYNLMMRRDSAIRARRINLRERLQRAA